MQDTSVQDRNIADVHSQSALHRRTMVDCQIRTFDVTDQLLLARLLEVPREDFLPAELASLAYSDLALQLKTSNPGEKPRTLLPPLVLARLIQGATLAATDRVLDVASGTGYSAAILAGLAGSVVALESDPALFAHLKSNLESFGLSEVKTVLGPLADGVASEGPFDVIFVNGAVETNLATLFAQLKEGGRLLALTCLPGDSGGRAGKAVRYEKIDGQTGFRVLFDASAPVLETFRKAEEFTFS
ncbi:protein-L-isoaspartate O-methyltransferase [Beijerinckiaceae bacterium]|nr:protein-L-isoaspartate O-methyltransferase [Beijerinckiaceae bacterium]